MSMAWRKIRFAFLPSLLLSPPADPPPARAARCSCPRLPNHHPGLILRAGTYGVGRGLIRVPSHVPNLPCRCRGRGPQGPVPSPDAPKTCDDDQPPNHVGRCVDRSPCVSRHSQPNPAGINRGGMAMAIRTRMRWMNAAVQSEKVILPISPHCAARLLIRIRILCIHATSPRVYVHVVQQPSGW